MINLSLYPPRDTIPTNYVYALIFLPLCFPTPFIIPSRLPQDAMRCLLDVVVKEEVRVFHST